MTTQSSPIITEMKVIPVAGHDSMLLNIGGAHNAWFTRNIVVLTDNAGNTGVGEAPGGEVIYQTLLAAIPQVVGQEVARLNRVVQQVHKGNQAADFVKGLLERMHVDGTVLANVGEDGVRLYIDKSTMGMLIGHRGETLDAMQYLTSLAVNRNRKQDGYTRISIDTEGYREKREETLARLAKRIANQVKATGRPRTLEPMNPYERRVLHATLQNNPYVATRSEGEEPNRRVVIFPKGSTEDEE